MGAPITAASFRHWARATLGDGVRLLRASTPCVPVINVVVLLALMAPPAATASAIAPAGNVDAVMRVTVMSPDTRMTYASGR
jgi:hypothetical protein